MLYDEENGYVGRFSVEKKMFSFHHRVFSCEKNSNKFDGAKNSDQNRKRNKIYGWPKSLNLKLNQN